MKKKILILVCILVLLLYVFMFQTFAQEKVSFSTADHEIVFLLDTSNSMNSQDPLRLAIDGIRQMMYALPSGSKMGLVAYDTKIQTVVPLTESIQQMETELSNIQYSGYTNAGEGFTQAIDLFTDHEDTRKYLIMMSDGEIMMKKEEDTLHSRELFSNAAKVAKEKGIQVYITAIGSELKEGMHIFDAAEMTNGAIYWQGASGSISQIAERILTERLNLPMKSAGIMEGKNGAFRMELPDSYADRVTILLTADKKIENVNASYSASDGQIITGSAFAAVKLNHPTATALEVTFEAAKDAGVRAWIMTEYRAKLNVDVTYSSKEIPPPEEKGKKSVLEYEHYADLTFTLLDQDSGDNIWDAQYYQGKKITFYINEIEFQGEIKDGSVSYTFLADGAETISVDLDTSGFYEKLYLNEIPDIAVKIPPDPIPEPKPDYRPLIAVLSVLLLVFVIIVVLCIKKSRSGLIYVSQPAPEGGMKKCETKACEYTGKLNLYVVQTDNGRDIAPQTFRLFGRKSGRMTLDWILNTCKVKLQKIGSEEIIFYPGPDKSIIVMDQSERCTVMRGMEILKKGIGYPLFFNEKLTVTFEDGITEIEIHYKNLKPNEREGNH